jgi:hypothetical protein
MKILAICLVALSMAGALADRASAEWDTKAFWEQAARSAM